MRAEKTTLLKIAENLVRYGRKQGADQVEVSVGEGTEFSVDVREGNIEKLEEAGSKHLSLKIIRDARVATGSSSDLTEETLHRLVDNALERASLANPDPFAALPEHAAIRKESANLKIFDPMIVELPPEEKIAAAKETEAICLADKRIKKSYGSSYSTSIGRILLVNSNGFSGSYDRTSCTCGVYLQAGEGDNLFEEGKYDNARNLDDLMQPEAIANEAVHRVTRLIGARKVETQNVPVVFEPQMTSSMLSFLYTCINGNSVYLKQTFLADKLGDSIASDRITIIDDGLLPGGPGTRPFDAEGVPTQKTHVIENGILKHFLLDTYAARKLNLQSTGNGSGATNFYLEAGSDTPDRIIQSVDQGLLLTGTIGFGLVPVTGDISRGAFGLWIEGGEIAYPVAEITISGNLGHLLKDIHMIGNDLEFKRVFSGPTIKVAEMTIGGK